MDKMEVSNQNDERNDVAVAAIAADAPPIFKLRADDFRKFIPHIEIWSNDEDASEDDFRFVGSNCKSAKQIEFVDGTLTPAKIEHLKPIVDQIESIRMRNVRFLFDNQRAFLGSLIKLDDLAILGEMNSDLVALLNELHGKGFYKRLHLYFVQASDFGFISKLNGLNKIHYWTGGFVTLPGLNTAIYTGLKELAFGLSLPADMEELAKSLVNLERLCIGRCNYNQLLPFIRHSKFLKKISISEYIGDVIDLKAWNEERKKLIGYELVTRKLMVYMQEDTYLKFKWANVDTSLDFIELRRRESHHWGHHFTIIENVQ